MRCSLGTWIPALCLLLSCWASHASAQLKPKAVRLGLDVDIFSAGAVWTRPPGFKTHEVTRVVSLGVNEIGNSRVTIPNTPIGVSGDLVLHPKWMLGLRAGFGFDHLNADHDRPDTNAFSMSFMPAVTYVPTTIARFKPFVKFSPVAQFTQLKQSGEGRQHIFMGCFSVGAGSFLFVGDRGSVDLGAYFEGRFGQLKVSGAGGSTDVDDLRGVLRLGVSLWSAGSGSQR